MKREELKSVFAEATDEQIDKVMGINGADIEKAKGKLAEVTSELNEKKEAFENLTKEFDSLKENNASADEYKEKYDSLVADIDAKEKEAAEKKAAQDKADSIKSRFDAVVGEKKFAHPAIRESYGRKFAEALENKDFEGKSDADIFSALTKDDANAFEGVSSFRLEGGNQSENQDVPHPIPKLF